MYTAKCYSARHKRRLVRARADLELEIAQPGPNKCHLSPNITTSEPEPVVENNNNYYSIEISEDEDDYSIKSDIALDTCDESDPDLDAFDMSERMQDWALKHHVSQSAITELLHILGSHSCFTNLPKDARTLLKTPRSTEVTNIPPGEYIHIGLEEALKKSMRGIQNVPKEIKLQIGIDGLPVQRSNNTQFWPILVFISSLKTPVETVGIYSGCTKPADVNLYLQKLIEDLHYVLQYGFMFHEEQISVKFEGFICDAPARSFISGTKCHTGYSSCSKCYERGVWRNKVVLIGTDAKLRTDVLFRKRDDPHHHTRSSDIENLPIDCIRCVPLDYMHLKCLGVMRKLLFLWTRGPIASFRISASQQEQISTRLQTISRYFGRDFARKPRSLKEADHWKATEFRTFLLYSGPVVLKSIIREKYYQHFLCFHVATRILCCNVNIKHHLDYARSLLKYFVKMFADLYGEHNCTYNIHGLIHICDDAEKFGTLDSFSAFPFENKLGYFKKLLKKPNCLLQQVHRRISEESSKLPKPEPIKKLVKWTGIFRDDLSDTQFMNAFYKSFEIRCHKGDNVVILNDGSIVQVLTIGTDSMGKCVFLERKYKNCTSFYTTPCNSEICGIFAAKILSHIQMWNLSDICQKCIALPLDRNESAIFPILHTGQEQS